MAHRFTVHATIPGVSLSDFKRLSADTSLHEKVCRRIPGDKLEILESRIDQGVYTLKREASCDRSVTGDDQQIHIKLDWQVKVKVPLIGGMLEKHAEGEIRKFSDIEIEIVEDELRKNLQA